MNGFGARPRGACEAAQDSEHIESIDLLDGGTDAYPRMLASIALAKQSVHLEVYGFAPTGIGAQFIDALGLAAKRGVRVDVTIDGWGSLYGGNVVEAQLRGAGCEVKIFGRIRSLLISRFGRNHRKILLIDDVVAFVGGINIGDENLSDGKTLGWADLAIEIHGLPCARLGAMIRDDKRHATNSALKIHLSGLGGGWRLRRRYLRAFAAARKSIHLAHGYFMPDPGIVRALMSAARRGVEVQLLLAGCSDVPFARAVTRSVYGRLLRAGVEIREWGDSVLHAKVATVDQRYLLVGSYNLDPFSLTNQEILVVVENLRVVEKADAWIHDHFVCSRAIAAIQSMSRWQRWILDPFGRIVAHVADRASRKLVAQRRRNHDAMRTDRPAIVLRLIRKVIVAAIGSSVLAIGILLIVLPGPAFIVIPLGLTILATEFLWARQFLRWVKLRIRSKT